MSFNPDNHHRRSIRLDGYDYSSSGAYFITIGTYQRQCLFGNVIDGAMHLNDMGHIVAEEWMRSQTIRQEIQFDEWVIMPNHIHGIVWIQSPDTSDNPVGAHGGAPARRQASQPNRDDHCPNQSAKTKTTGEEHQQSARAHSRAPLQPTSQPKIGIAHRRPRSLSSFIAGFKSATTKRINRFRNAPGTPVWQRNYYDHIIRDDRALHQIRHYIQTNPSSWTIDQLHPENPSKW
jgi:REP element-mobilizing transposase RayT